MRPEVERTLRTRPDLVQIDDPVPYAGASGSVARTVVPAPGGVSMRDGAAVGPDGGLDDGQAQTAPAAVALTGCVGAVEPLEGPGRVRRRHARARRRRPRASRRRRRGPTRRWIGASGAWTRALPTRLATTWRRLPSSPRTTVGAAASTVISRSGATAWASRAASRASAARSTGARSSGRPWSRRASWSRSSTSDAHPQRLLLGAPHGLVELALPAQGPRPVQLGVPADRGDRGAQLVGRVGDEAPQPVLGRGAHVERVLDAAEHAVEGHPQVTGLGAGMALGDALGQVSGGDRPCGGGHAAERSDAEPDHPPGDQAQHAQHGEHGQPGDALEAADGVVDVAQRQGHDDHGAAGALGAGQHPVAHVRVGAAHAHRLAVAEAAQGAGTDDRHGVGVGPQVRGEQRGEPPRRR